MYNAEKIKEWLLNLSNAYNENKYYLIELDSKIVDADHGINMDRGFYFVKEMINN